MRSLLRRLRTRLPPTSGEPTDEQLLDSFLARRVMPEAGEDAFAAIVRRHGPMVRGVCRRMLRNDADADDAFQAVFVVLVRKADAVRPRSQLGNWLYGVAVNVARRCRDGIMRRRTQELITDVPQRETDNMHDASELRAVIDQELSGLPDAYRAAVVACDLEGATRTEAAGRLGWSEGTVASRLARGRALLADRLSRRGVTIPAAGLVAVFGSATADAVPPVIFQLLASNPSPAVEALATEAIKAMTTGKLKSAAVVILATIALAGAGTATVWACGGIFPRPAPPVSEAKPFPDRSVETTVAPAAGPSPVWDRPEPKEVPAFAEKPGGENAGIAKPALFVMTNPAKDITIVSDRHEKFVEFFRRQPVLVAVLPANVRDKMLYDPKGSDGPVFVDSASFNLDGPRNAAYGASVKLAPLPPDGPAFRLMEMTPAKHPVVFVRDAADKNLWHAVGFTTRSPVGFFASKDRVKPDDFAPADLLEEKPKDEKDGKPKKEPKPARLVNPGKDIFVISDREETIPQFFARQTVIVGAADLKTLELIAKGKGTSERVFFNYTRANDDIQAFGTFAKAAAPSPAVAELIAEGIKGRDPTKGGLVVILLRDAKEKGVFHVVGYTHHESHRFFEIEERSAGDDFAPIDLLHKNDKK